MCDFQGVKMARWLSWLERRPVTAEVDGSSPFRVARFDTIQGILAQLGEHLPYKQRVTGSSPVRVIRAGLAELADAPDLGSGALGRGGSSPLTRIEI